MVQLPAELLANLPPEFLDNLPPEIQASLRPRTGRDGNANFHHLHVDDAGQHGQSHRIPYHATAYHGHYQHYGPRIRPRLCGQKTLEVGMGFLCRFRHRSPTYSVDNPDSLGYGGIFSSTYSRASLFSLVALVEAMEFPLYAAASVHRVPLSPSALPPPPSPATLAALLSTCYSLLTHRKERPHYADWPFYRTALAG